MLHWFGHRWDCPKQVVPVYRGEEALVCAECMADYVPRCPLCDKQEAALRSKGGFIHYNFCRIHRSLRVTPAMEAGVSDHVWEIEEVVNLLDR